MTIINSLSRKKNLVPQQQYIMLFELLCAKLCHDIANPICSISNGIEMLDNNEDQCDIQNLLTISSSELVNRIKLYRNAYGPVDANSCRNLYITLEQIGELLKYKGIIFNIALSQSDSESLYIDNGANKAIINLFIFMMEILIRGNNVDIKITRQGTDLALSIECSGKIASGFNELITALQANNLKIENTNPSNAQVYYTNMIMQKFNVSAKVLSYDGSNLKIIIFIPAST